MNELKTIKKLLIIITIPLVFYLLHILSFIFIPLLGAILLALFFMPMMRAMEKKGIPKLIRVSVSVLLLVAAVLAFIVLIRLSAQEILSADAGFWEKLSNKLDLLFAGILQGLGVESIQGMTTFGDLMQSENMVSMIFSGSGETIGVIGNSITKLLMMLFFLVLLLSESVNVQRIMGEVIFKRNLPSVRTYRSIEKSMVKFIKVKFLLSLFTGI
jgi:predicted PurR-regulated permease PerM